MPDPTKQSAFLQWFGPVLNALRALGGSGKPREVTDHIVANVKVPENLLNETLASGQTKFYNQVHWARQYLVWEGLLDSSIRGTWSLTARGWEAKLNEENAREIFRKWVKNLTVSRRGKPKSEDALIQEAEIQDPERFELEHGANLLDVLKSLSPKGFEEICALLLRESGFEEVVVRGRTGDGGIDGFGTLAINPFVSIRVMFQCKRYRDGSVSRSEVGDFRNATWGRAEKGIFITTSRFSKDAIAEAQREGVLPIELINGERLVKMFERIELGVRPRTVYEVQHGFFEPYTRK